MKQPKGQNRNSKQKGDSQEKTLGGIAQEQDVSHEQKAEQKGFAPDSQEGRRRETAAPFYATRRKG
jgi:hypothetical protein